MAVHDRWRVVRYYYAVGLTIFSITMCYSGATLAFATVGSAVFVTKTPPLPCGLLVVFPPITLAGLLYFNAKHFVDKYNL